MDLIEISPYAFSVFVYCEFHFYMVFKLRP